MTPEVISLTTGTGFHELVCKMSRGHNEVLTPERVWSGFGLRLCLSFGFFPDSFHTMLISHTHKLLIRVGTWALNDLLQKVLRHFTIYEINRLSNLLGGVLRIQKELHDARLQLVVLTGPTWQAVQKTTNDTVTIMVSR